jgi:hypothetical protein
VGTPACSHVVAVSRVRVSVKDSESHAAPSSSGAANDSILSLPDGWA